MRRSLARMVNVLAYMRTHSDEDEDVLRRGQLPSPHALFLLPSPHALSSSPHMRTHGDEDEERAARIKIK